MIDWDHKMVRYPQPDSSDLPIALFQPGKGEIQSFTLEIIHGFLAVPVFNSTSQ